MASKTSPSARGAGRALPLAENNNCPEVLDPRKDISKKKKGGISSPATAVLERPPPPAFTIFMCDFKRSKECESIVTKAVEDKWNSMSAAEKSPFAKRASEMVVAMDKGVEFYKMIRMPRKQRQQLLLLQKQLQLVVQWSNELLRSLSFALHSSYGDSYFQPLNKKNRFLIWANLVNSYLLCVFLFGNHGFILEMRLVIDVIQLLD